MAGDMADYYGDPSAELADLLRYDEETKKHLASEQYWKSRNGRVTRIDLMDDRHLTNTIKMLERQGIERALPLLEEENELLRETQLKMMGFSSTLVLKRYKNMVAEHAVRKEEEEGE
jgi:hypothetical protein